MLSSFGIVRKFFMFAAFRPICWRILLFVTRDAFGEGVAMDTEDDGGLGEVLFVTRERLRDVKLFEL